MIYLKNLILLFLGIAIAYRKEKDKKFRDIGLDLIEKSIILEP